MTESLVVQPEQGPEHWSNPEGGGVVSSWADVGKAIGAGGDPFRTSFALAAAGLDTLGLIADPFDAVAGAAAGYLMEHIAILRAPLDALAGDPRRITAQAKSWHNASVELADVAAGCRRAAAGSSAWEGAAGNAQRTALADHARRIDEVAQRAGELAGLLVSTGAAVGTVRAIVRDMIADFIAYALEKFLLWSMGVFVTGGVSAVAAIGSLIYDAVQLANRIADRIAVLLTTLSEAGGLAGRIADGMIDAAERVVTVAPDVHRTATHLDEVYSRVPVAQVTEAGKQFSSAEPLPQTGTLT